MAMVVPMVFGFEPVPQSSTHPIMVPSVTDTRIHYEQPHVMYPAGVDMWGAVYSMTPGAYDAADLNVGSYGSFNQQTYSEIAAVCHPGKATDVESTWPNVEWHHADGSTKGKQANSMIPIPRRHAFDNSWGHTYKAPIHGDTRLQQSERIDDNLHVSIVINNLPKVLHSESCLAAAFEQAGVDDSVRLFSVKKGNAVVILKSELAAQRLMKRFQGMKSGRSSRGVTTRYCAEAGKELMLKSEQKRDQPEAKEEEAEPPVSLESKMVQNKVEHISAITPLVLTRNALKRWADYDDDSNFDEGDTQSTIAGPEFSISDSMESSNPDEL